jgi:hypothetical protein
MSNTSGEMEESDQEMEEVVEHTAEAAAAATAAEDTPPAGLDEREQRRLRRKEVSKEDESLLDEEETEEVSGRFQDMKLRLRNYNPMPQNKIEIEKLLVSEANPSGAEDKLPPITAANPSGAAEGSSYPSGGGPLKGQSSTINTSYETVASLRSGQRTNPSLSQGGKRVIEKSKLGSFGNSGDGRAAAAHFRSLTENRVNRNISYSFDPKTCICSVCPGRAGHSVCGGEGGLVRQTFILSDQNFPAIVPCNGGECLKVVRVEEGSLSEIVNVWLETTKGKDFPAGSVVVLFSASHLLMRGLAGYLSDMAVEFGKIDRIFKGRVIPFPGVPILLGGVSDPFMVRLLFEIGKWFQTLKDPFPFKTWDLVLGSVSDLKVGDQSIQKNKYNVPTSLHISSISDFETWVSDDWPSIPIGAQPLTVEWEEKIMKSLVGELNEFYYVGLGKEPIIDRLCEETTVHKKPAILSVGASHSRREGEILARRGYEVTLCGRRGWRAHSFSTAEMKNQLEKALVDLKKDDIVLVHCLDSTMYLSRTEDGGDLPIRQYANGEYHVDGELTLACKDRQYSLFKNILPFLKLLENRRVVFIIPIIRYLNRSCCDHPEHVTNSEEPGFEENLRAKLAECQRNFKDFLFCSGLRGVKVLDPNPALPNNILEEEEQCWGLDPVHPEQEGYERVVDLIEKEIEKFSTGAGKNKRKSPSEECPAPKRARTGDNRATWVTAPPTVAARVDVPRGGQGGPYRGRPFRGRAFRGRHFRGRY